MRKFTFSLPKSWRQPIQFVALIVGWLIAPAANAQFFTIATCSSPVSSNEYGPMNSDAAANSTNRTAVIYPATQLTAISGQTITNLYFLRNAAGSAMIGSPSLKIYLKEVTATDWGASAITWATEIAGASLVFDGDPTAITGTTAGYKNFPLAANYTYSGSRNLAVFFEYINPAANNLVNWTYEYTGPCVNTSNSNTTKYSNNATGTLSATLASTDYRRPFIGFDIFLTCYPPTSITVPAATITTTTAVVNWTAPASAPAGGYEYYQNASGTAPTTGTTPTGTTAAGVTTANLSGLVSGTVNYVWVRSVCSGADKSPWTTAVSFNTLPENDEATGALPLTANPDYNCGATKNGSTIGSTQSTDAAPSCSATGINDDVWYSFVATATAHRINFTNVTTGTMVAAVYSGTPGSLVQVASACASTTLNLTGLGVGQTYYVRAYTSVATTTTVTNFTICLSTAPPPPVNDDCANAIALTVNPDFSCGAVTAGTITSATGTADATCTGTEDDDVWFKFIATNAAHRISLLNVAGSVTDMAFQLLDGCGGTSLLCSDPDVANVTGLTPGNTYYLRVYTFSSTTGQIVNFNVCIGTPPPPPANDNCAGAITVAVNPSTTCTSVTPGNVQSATASPGPVSSCGTYDDDVWFKFIAVEASHIITLQNLAGSTTDLTFQVLDACGATTALVCSDPQSATVGGLTPGNTYYLRVASYTATAGQTSTFDVCITTLPPMTYVSSTTTQSSTANTAIGAANQQVIRAEVVVIGATSPLSVTQLDFNTAGSTNPADIANARVYYTGTSTAFAPTTQFGTTVATPNGAFSVTGSQTLSGGAANTTNYFWLVYDIAPGATAGDVVDGTFTSGTVGGNSITPTATNPTGARTIVGALANDEATGAITLTVGGGCTGNPYDNTVASQSPQEPFPSCKGTAGYAGMWYRFVAPASGAVKISNDGTGSLGDSRIALFSAGDPNNYASFTILACDDDNGVTGGTRSLLYATGLNPGTTYYVLVDLYAVGGTRGTYCVTVDELAATMLSTATAGCSADQASVAAYNAAYTGWVSLVDATGNLNALVRQTAGSATGFASSRTITTGASRVDGAGIPYLNRNFFITSTGTATSADIVLFFTDAELASLGASLANLNVSRTAGSSCVATYPGGTTTLLPQTANGSVNGVSWLRATTPGFSNFYIHSGNVPLPVTLVYFSGTKSAAANQLNWKVNCTSTNVTFEIERSANGRSFNGIGKLSADQARCLTPFDFSDGKPLNGVNYYRLKIIDVDGQVTYTNVVAINNRTSGIELVDIQPTLVHNEAVLYIAAAKAGKLQIVVTDMAGRQLETRSITVVEGDNKINLSFGTLASGVYNITSINESVKSTIRFVKE